MSDEIIVCLSTGKKISGYDGELDVDPKLEDEARFLHCLNVKLTVTENMTSEDWEPIISKFENDGDVEECFPKISVSINSPYSDEQTEIILRNEIINDCLSTNAEKINLLGLQPGEYLYKEIYFGCYHGKFRGYMEIDFSEINTKEDLLEIVEELLLEEHEWDFDPDLNYMDVWVVK